VGHHENWSLWLDIKILLMTRRDDPLPAGVERWPERQPAGTSFVVLTRRNGSMFDEPAEQR
jgi:hypothetical protein